MGVVPLFYRWLAEKYPNAITSRRADGVVYDNLYLHMNDIVHLCFHPEDQRVTSPTTFVEVFRLMFQYMDRLVRIVRPTSLLYLALDGVAPCAKMNQQRAKHFKSAKAAKEAEMEENQLREFFKAEGKDVLPRDEACQVSDPNVITPGTEFMEKLSAALEYYVRDRLNSDPLWEDIKVILSDANVPGEAEHKIMSFIRAQRSREGYDPITCHCLYGLDADLVLHALASHEVHFSILREVVLRQIPPTFCAPITEEKMTLQELTKVRCRVWSPRVTEASMDVRRQNQPEICAPTRGTQELANVTPRGSFPRVTEESPKVMLPYKRYQFLNIWVLREYLELDMKIPDCEHDIERLIDDFIFICFLTGNDFIPHIPSLDIHEFAVDTLIEVYKTTFNKMGDHIVDIDKITDKHAAYLTVSRLEKLFHELSLHEEKIFRKRYEIREKLLCKIQRQAAENEWNEKNSDNVEESSDGPTQDSSSTCSSDNSDIIENTSELRRDLKEIIQNKQDLYKNGACKHDRIRLGVPGWKSRFYRQKYGIESSNEVGSLQAEMAQKYLEGLCWVLQYYFSDVPSWSWYYPFYYAPFASDLKRLPQLNISFTMNEPLRPLDHLMAVLPPESSCALPKCYSKLIGCEESTIQMFYPSELEVDTDGKRFLWQGVAKLPFVDEKLLLSVTKTVGKDLTPHEMRRNTVRQERIFLRDAYDLADNAAFVLVTDDHSSRKLFPISDSEIGGWLSPDDEGLLSEGLFRSPKNIYDRTVSAMFFNPEPVMPFPRLVDGVVVPDKTVTEDDIPKRPMWHTHPFARPRPVTHSHRPEKLTLWKASSPVLPREEIKHAGTGWMGRGRPSGAFADRQQVESSGYGHGRGFHEVQNRFDGRDVYSFRPVAPWARGGGSGQPRAW